MKKGLLIVCSALLLGVLGAKQANAQDYHLEFTNGPDGKRTASFWNNWKNAAHASYGTVGVPAQNGIHAWVSNASGRHNNLVFRDGDGPFINGRYSHAECKIVLESENPLTKVALQYTSGSATTGVKMKIIYGELPPDTTGMGPDLGPIMIEGWRGTLTTQVPTDLDGLFNNTDYPHSVGGGIVYFDVSDQATQYVEILRETSANVHLYRIAASTTDFTLSPLVLPLDILSFTAKTNALGNAVNLNWQTTNEVNTKEFVIERRTDNTEFAAIGTEASNNTSGIHSYNYTDNNVTAGNAYYRLKQVDNDGKFKYSDIVQVNVEAGLSLTVYPNPTEGVLNISHAPAANASVKILGLDGRVVANQAVANGNSSTNLDVSNLAAGNYLLVYNNSGKQSTVKFVKK